MRKLIILLSMLCWAAIPAGAQVSIGIGFPSVNIGINFGGFPQFAPVPGYPVYYAPQVDANYFFYDGMYWVYQSDNWYASSWYNGPWAMVSPIVVPVYILQVPVSYYRQPPVYFRAWPRDAPPRWGEHWGNDWQRQRSGWDHANHNAAPAPLPTYQRQYSGSRYPSVNEQGTITSQNYHYQPHDPVVQQHYQQFVTARGASASSQRGQPPPPHEPQQQSAPVPQPPSPPRSPQERPPASPPQPMSQDRPPSAQGDHPPRQPEAAPEERRPVSSGDNAAPREERKDQNKEEGGDKVQDKDPQRDNR